MAAVCARCSLFCHHSRNRIISTAQNNKSDGSAGERRLLGAMTAISREPRNGIRATKGGPNTPTLEIGRRRHRSLDKQALLLVVEKMSFVCTAVVGVWQRGEGPVGTGRGPRDLSPHGRWEGRKPHK